MFCKYSYYLVTSLLLANAINPQDINDYGCLIAHLVLSTYKGPKYYYEGSTPSTRIVGLKKKGFKIECSTDT